MPKKITIAVIDSDTAHLYWLGYWLKRNTTAYVYCFKSHEEYNNSLRRDADIIVTEMYFDGSTESTQKLIEWVNDYGLRTRILLYSAVEDMQEILKLTVTRKVIFIQKGTDGLEMLKEAISIYANIMTSKK